MKKTSPPNPCSDPTAGSDDLLPEYHFDYRKARPNRFVSADTKGSVAVTLDADVAAVFTTSESVNAVLRALIETMPPRLP